MEPEHIHVTIIGEHRSWVAEVLNDHGRGWINGGWFRVPWGPPAFQRGPSAATLRTVTSATPAARGGRRI